MIFNLCLACVFTLVFALNFTVAGLYTSREMQSHFIRGQNIVGLVFTNVFFAPAWALKGIRYLVIRLIP